MKTSIRSCLTLAAACGASIAFGQPTTSAPIIRDREVVRSADVKLKAGDRSFLEKAARSGLEEVEISRVAATRTSNPEVRRLAQNMIADHDHAFEELTALASLKGVHLPAKDAIAEKWAKRDAKSFDQDYIDKMVSDHEECVKLFEKHAKDGDDAEVVAFARKHLPKLQTHLQAAIDLKRAFKERR